MENEDQRSRDYTKIKDKFRPGHADYTYQQKYGIRDYRGGGRSSARETVMRVAAGAIARKYLAEQARRRDSRLSRARSGRYGSSRAISDAVDENPFFCADPERVAGARGVHGRAAARRRFDRRADQRRRERACRAGLGEPVFDKLEAELAHALMSINAVKGVEFGDGFKCVEQRGSEHRDEITPDGFKKNSSGGTLGGISTGQDILVEYRVETDIEHSGAGQYRRYARATRPRSSRRAGTILAWACVRHRSPKPWSR